MFHKETILKIFEKNFLENISNYMKSLLVTNYLSEQLCTVAFHSYRELRAFPCKIKIWSNNALESFP